MSSIVNQLLEQTTLEQTTLEQTPLKTTDATQTKTDSWDDFFNDLATDETVIPDIVQHQTLDETELDFDEAPIKQPVETNNGYCHQCGSKQIISSGMLICKSCGLETQTAGGSNEEDYSTSALTDCNVDRNGFMAMKITGKGSHGLQKSLLRTCANYKLYVTSNTYKEVKKWNSLSEKNHIPKNVIHEAIKMFSTIRDSGYVFRKDGKKGVLSACLYYCCYNNSISKTPSEVAQFSGIEEKFHSFGDRILQHLRERGIIDIPAKINPINDYVDRYMELLEIDKKYKSFIIDLIARAEAKRIHILHDSKANTKSAGAIYMLVDRIPELKARITKEQIEKECGISRTTFIRYATILSQHYRLVKKVFKKYRVSMPREWKD